MRKTMETSEFDASLGGTEHLPYSANSLKFAASRSVEIAAMTESILRPSKTKLIFQTLPVHMRRRVMSHNCKRLPRKLREGHLEQLKKSGLPPKQKRPSRKYRRRPANLLDEYNRRQKQNVWLETHIWHAKRFHMIERWGHRLAHAPCDKAFRACYRASSAHCLIQDMSYNRPFKITGPIEVLQNMFRCLTNSSCGLGICAKAFTNGNREGTAHMYKANLFPFGYIGKIHFIWIPSDNSRERTLFLFVHPSQANEVETALRNLSDFEEKYKSNSIPEKRRRVTDRIKIETMSGAFNRFRLTGPNSHAVLIRSLKCVTDIEKIKRDDWVSSLPQHTSLHLTEKHDYWQSISLASSPSQLIPRQIVGLVVRDPRLSRPSHRTKAQPENYEETNVNSLINLPKAASASPVWDTSIHEIMKKKRMSNTQFIEHVTKTQLVPGEVNIDDPAIQSVPILLIQRPGSQTTSYKKVGYGCGWDVIVPSGYGLPFWQTFIMFGARSGGLRETESIALEMGECYLPPDCNAGKNEEMRIETELRERYFRLPPSKRVNYLKLGVNSPFISPWKILLNDWNNNAVDDLYVLRDKKTLNQLQDCILRKKAVPELENSAKCLVPVYLQMTGKGSLKRHALICLPQLGDIETIKTLFEPHHVDPNEKLRKLKRTEHMKNIKRWRRKQIKQKKNGEVIKMTKLQPSEYVKSMRELWLPSEISTVRHCTKRQVMGYLSQGAFSFSEAHSCGVGYIAYNALATLLSSIQNMVLVRNASSRKYRLANIRIIEDT